MPNIFLFALLLLAQALPAQKFLQIERLHSPKTRKFAVGDEITFQLIGQEGWYTRVIEDIHYEQQLVQFAYGQVHVDSIAAIRIFNSRRWSRPLGNQLFNFAIAWQTFSLISTAVDETETFRDNLPRDAVVVGSSVLTGFLLQRIFRHRTFRLSNPEGTHRSRKWRLRALDLEVRR
ncbi:MAG: hypothetical protein D6765_12935 [Bacteroidetes bacterium]|nr:MAG: hypothetical protein D6765_12935 [Bacteroidota bacterium]